MRPSSALSGALQLVLALLAGAAVISCRSDPGGTPPTDGPSAPSFSGPFGAASRDDVRVGLTLDRATFVPLEQAWAVVVVENAAAVPRHFQGGGCNFLADIQVSVSRDVSPDPGRVWGGVAGTVKNLAGTSLPPSRTAGFVDEHFVGQSFFACPADLGVNTLQPGERREMRAAWDGEINGMPAPAGPATVHATFSYLGPNAGQGDPLAHPQPIKVSIAADIADTGERLMSPGQAVDAALGDPRFNAWITSAPLAAWSGVETADHGVLYDTIVIIGPTEGRATVDRRTGAVTFRQAPRP